MGASTDSGVCRWWEAHAWSLWKDKAWSKLVRVHPFRTTTSTADNDEVGLECIQERRCARCGKLELRSERTQL